VEVGPGAEIGASPILRIISLVMLAAPIAGIILNNSGRLALGQRTS
jgi:hypothetical protein